MTQVRHIVLILFAHPTAVYSVRANRKKMTKKIDMMVTTVAFFSFFFSFLSGWVKVKLKLPHLHVSDRCRVSI